jgi:NAD(P)H-nitrite reductase large subunit
MNLSNKNADRRDHLQGDDLICFCFRYTRQDIERDFIKNGCSTILEKIKREKSTGSCQCEANNPAGK